MSAPDYNIARLKSVAGKMRLKLLEMHFNAKCGHIGGNLSVIDILATLYHQSITSDDHVILSKGHAAGALYIALWSKGILSDDELKTFHQNGTKLAGHPPANVFPDIPFATGSLGHGLSLACGLAAAKKLKNRGGRIYCVTSDGEWGEGSTWEALMFATHHRLQNLTVIVDLNGLQGFGSTKDVSGLNHLSEKIRSFCPEVLEINGHDYGELVPAMQRETREGPNFVIAKTIKGCGVSFMEGAMEWHYLPMSSEQYTQAQREISIHA